MVPGLDESLRVRHETENSPGRVAYAGDCARGPIGVSRIILGRPGFGPAILKNNLAAALECGQRRTVGHEEAALAMSHRQLDRLRERDERREPGPRQKSYPSVFKPTGFVGCERGRSGWTAGQQAAAHQYLKPVADAENQAAAVMKTPKRFAERRGNSGREDAAGAQVVAVGKPAGDHQDLEPIERGRRFDHLVDVPGFGEGTGETKGVGCLFVTVGARCSEDNCVR